MTRDRSRASRPAAGSASRRRAPSSGDEDAAFAGDDAEIVGREGAVICALGRTPTSGSNASVRDAADLGGTEGGAVILDGGAVSEPTKPVGSVSLAVAIGSGPAAGSGVIAGSPVAATCGGGGASVCDDGDGSGFGATIHPGRGDDVASHTFGTVGVDAGVFGNEAATDLGGGSDLLGAALGDDA